MRNHLSWVWFSDPAQSFDGLYPYPIMHTYDRQAMVDLDEPDYDNWPKLSQVCCYERWAL
eukprot:1178189-Prorocentrum_minimum.AAC.1